MPRLLPFKSFVIPNMFVARFKLKQTIFLLVFSVNLFTFLLFLFYESTTNNSRVESEKQKEIKDIINHNNGHIETLLKESTETRGEFHGSSWFEEHQIFERTQNCDNYFDKLESTFNINKNIINEYEKKHLNRSMSLAFTHMMHHQVAIYEMFLALYFRPNNFYCVHVDIKSSDLIRKTVENVVNCYSKKTTAGKIFVLDKKQSLDVKWGQPNMLNADLKCIKELVNINKERIAQNNKHTWKYSSSVAGVELPIVTYAKFHKTVENLGESSSVESFAFNQVPRNSSEHSIFNSTNKQLLLRLSKSQRKSCLNCVDSKNPNGWNLEQPLVFKLPNPLKKDEQYKFQMFKGLKNVILYWKDADFMINHPVAKKFHKWQRNQRMPEETFFATLIRFKVDHTSNHISQDTTSTTTDTTHGICSRFTQWKKKTKVGKKGSTKWEQIVRMAGMDYPTKSRCRGKFLHLICNLSRLDLGKISEKWTRCLIANKFNTDVDHLAVRQHFQNVLRKSLTETRSATL